MAACAFSSRNRQEANHSASHGEAPSSAAVSQEFVALRWNSVATRLGSAHCPHGSTTITRAPVRAASRTYSLSARESHGVPSITIVSGSGGFVRTIESAAAIVPATLLPERGSARTGQPSRSASASTRSGSGGRGESPPTMRSPRPRSGSAICERRLILGNDDPRSWARRQRRGRPGQGFAELEVEVNRSCARSTFERLRKGPDGQGSPCRFLSVGGDAGRSRPAGRRREEAHLFDGLGGPGVMELGWSVSGADDQRNPCLVCLDHSGMQLGRGSPARDADHGRSARRHGKPQREEGPTALVETDVGTEPFLQGQRQGGRPRAGTDHSVGDP